MTFHNASGGSDVIYVRDESGNPLYSWTDPDARDRDHHGTPQWITTCLGGTHYLYVSVNGAAANTGKVYRLIDTGTGTTSRDADLAHARGRTSGAYYSCGCTITSDALARRDQRLLGEATHRREAADLRDRPDGGVSRRPAGRSPPRPT